MTAIPDIPEFPEIDGRALDYIVRRQGSPENVEYIVAATNNPDKPVGSTVTQEVLDILADTENHSTRFGQNEGQETFCAVYVASKRM